MTPTARRAASVALAVLLPLALLGAVEGGLRLAGYGHAYRAFVPLEGSPGYLVLDPALARPYFPDPADARLPHRDAILAEKTPETFRVFVQGASSAAGFPYYFGGAFSRMLRQRLSATFPERRVEVVNVAFDATNSYALLDIARQLVAWEPDAVLVYAGHNEYYGTYGVGSSVSVAGSPWMVRSYLSLKRLRLVQLLDAALARARTRSALDGGSGSGGDGTLMERLAGERALRGDSPLHAAAADQLRSNMDRLLALWADAGVPVFVGMVASNERDQAPLVSEPGPGVDAGAWARDAAGAEAAAARGDTAAALAAVARLHAADALAPWPWWLEGRLLDVPATRDEAAAAYRRARDLDQLPFRAPSAINRTLREVAAARGAVVVESEARLAEASPGGIVGHELILEHLHPDLEGQLLLADAFYRALEAAELPAPFPSPVPLEVARREAPVTAVDSLAGLLWIRSLTSRWPFRPNGEAGRATPDTLVPEGPVGALARALYRREVTWPEATTLLYFAERDGGHPEEAMRAARALAEEVPLLPWGHLYAAEAALRLGRPADARDHLLRAQAVGPTAWGARTLAALEAGAGRRAAAAEQLALAARLSGEVADRTAVRAFQALPALEREARGSDDPALWSDLAGAYLLTGQRAGAREAARRALDLDPGREEARAILGRSEAPPPPLPRPGSGAPGRVRAPPG